MIQFKFAFVFLIFVVFIILLSVVTSLFGNTNQQAKGKEGNAIRILVRQISRWTLASQQDQNSLIALLHANYGAGYLWALKDIVSESEIRAALPDLDLKKLTELVVSTQDSATKRIANQLRSTSEGTKEAESFLTKWGT